MNRRPGRPLFENDDYSRYSGPGFRQDYHGAHFRPLNLDRLSLSHGYVEPKKDFTGKGPKGYSRRDSYIHEDACEALTLEPYVDAREIEVEVDHGILTLRGSVPDRPMKRRAQACVEDLTGVQDVINKLKIVPMNEAGTQAVIKNQSGLRS